MKVTKISSNVIEFTDGYTLQSDHDSDCCEYHYLSMGDLTLDDFRGLEFDLSKEGFFKRIPDYGIELMPINGHSVKIPGYGFNNGYYSPNLTLVVSKDGVEVKRYGITECQKVTYAD